MRVDVVHAFLTQSEKRRRIFEVDRIRTQSIHNDYQDKLGAGP